MIAIVDYKAGNLRSVLRACQALGQDACITPDAAAVAGAERIIFPGVGAAPSAMRTLRERGLDEALRTALAAGTPILGICLGTQIVLEHSEEGDVNCLGLLPGRVARFRPADAALKIPHMGWNAVRARRSHPLLDGLREGDEFYFVHSYRPVEVAPELVYAETDYDGPFCSAMGRGNLFATQFHPEKSGRPGLELLERFARWDGRVPGEGDDAQ